MRVTKRQLKRIIAEERRKLMTESVTDMRQLEEEVSNAAFGVATTFSGMMYKLKDEMPPGEFSPTWEDEVDRAESELEDRIRRDINAAIQEIEAKLTNIGYSDFPSR
jgi:ketol-acid reductoisomerase